MIFCVTAANLSSTEWGPGRGDILIKDVFA